MTISRTSTLLTATLCVAMTAATTGLFAQAESDARQEQVDELFAEWDNTYSPGCALGVIQNGEFIYRRGYGMAHLEHDAPIRSNTVFYIASTSKQFVAASVILAAEQGYLSLDDDIHTHVPEMPDYGKTITVRHLLHHTSGIRDFLTLWPIAGENFADVHEPEEALALIARQKHLNFEPGAEHLYSNSGYFLLGVIVERATGKTLREFARENIFDPLGMEHSHFHDDHLEISKGRALGYVWRDDGGLGQYLSNFDLVGSGGLHTSVNDLLLWDQNFYQDRLGEGTLLPELHRRGVLTNGDTIDYAAGLSLGTYKGLRTVGHGGGAQGYRTELLRFPDQNFSVICLCNLGAMDPTGLALRVADIYLADEFAGRAEAAASEPSESPELVPLPAEDLEIWAGPYRNPETGTIWRVSVEGERLRVQIGTFAFHLGPISETEFVALDAPFRMDARFEPAGNGLARIQVRFADGDSATFEPVELAEPSAAELAAYTGAYYSDELDATWELVLRDGQLAIEHERDAVLQPLVRDEFTISGATVRFVRDADGAISHLVIDAGRVRDLNMVRQD